MKRHRAPEGEVSQAEDDDVSRSFQVFGLRWMGCCASFILWPQCWVVMG